MTDTLGHCGPDPCNCACNTSTALGISPERTVTLTAAQLDALKCVAGTPPPALAATNISFDACGYTVQDTVGPAFTREIGAGNGFTVHTTPTFTLGAEGVVMIHFTYGGRLGSAAGLPIPQLNVIPSNTFPAGALGPFTVQSHEALSDPSGGGRFHYLAFAPIITPGATGTVSWKLEHPTNNPQTMVGALAMQVNQLIGVDPANPIKQTATVPLFVSGNETSKNSPIVSPSIGTANWNHWANTATFATPPTNKVLMTASTHHTLHNTDKTTSPPASIDPAAPRARDQCGFVRDSGMISAAAPLAAHNSVPIKSVNGGNYNNCNTNTHTALMDAVGNTVQFERVPNNSNVNTQLLHANKANLGSMFHEVNIRSADPSNCTPSDVANAISQGSVITPTANCDASATHLLEVDTRGGTVRMVQEPGADFEIIRMLGNKEVGRVRNKNTSAAVVSHTFPPIVGNDLVTSVSGTQNFETKFRIIVWSIGTPVNPADVKNSLTIDPFDAKATISAT